MKPLILSFFAVILCVSLFTNKEEEVKSESVPPTMNENSVYFEVQPNLQTADSIIYFKNKLAYLQ